MALPSSYPRRLAALPDGNHYMHLFQTPLILFLTLTLSDSYSVVKEELGSGRAIMLLQTLLAVLQILIKALAPGPPCH